MHDPQPGTPAWNTEGDLINMLRACPLCRPAAYVLCGAHRWYVEELYPPCKDPGCPACGVCRAPL